MRIYEPKGRAREYSPLAVNIYKGKCPHQCEYCYVKRFPSPVYTKNECVAPMEADFIELEESAKSYQGCNKQILLCFTGDPYCGVNPEATRRVLEILNRYEHKVAILTKGGNRLLQDIDLFKQFRTTFESGKTVGRIIVGATLTFDNDTDSKHWEPYSALPQERIDSLRKLSEAGIFTWVSFEPVIYPEQSINLLKQVSSFIKFVKIGKINNYGDWDKDVDWDDFIKQAVAICRKANVLFYIKDDLAQFNKSTELSPQERNPDYLTMRFIKK